jgi:hypothetical protein
MRKITASSSPLDLQVDTRPPHARAEQRSADLCAYRVVGVEQDRGNADRAPALPDGEGRPAAACEPGPDDLVQRGGISRNGPGHVLPHPLVRQRLEQLHGVGRIVGTHRDGPCAHLRRKADGPLHEVILVDGLPRTLLIGSAGDGASPESAGNCSSVGRAQPLSVASTGRGAGIGSACLSTMRHWSSSRR